MNNEQAIKILKTMNVWRRYDGEPDKGPVMPCPREFGEAVDFATRALKAAQGIAEELEDYRLQYQCDCTHPACSRCCALKESGAALEAFWGIEIASKRIQGVL